MPPPSMHIFLPLAYFLSAAALFRLSSADIGTASHYSAPYLHGVLRGRQGAVPDEQPVCGGGGRSVG
ncbi:hypothetical protein LINPERPRIM_LOCUS19657 [Linum perenne]